MLSFTFTSIFKKDHALMKNRSKDMGKLIEMISLLVNEQSLMQKYEIHPLYGEHQGKWECHIEPNWLVIYHVDEAKRRVIFYRTGSHSDLF